MSDDRPPRRGQSRRRNREKGRSADGSSLVGSCGAKTITNAGKNGLSEPGRRR